MIHYNILIHRQQMYQSIIILYNLEQKSVYVDWKKNDRKEYYCIYSRSGFTKELMELAGKRGNVVLLS